MASGSQVLEEFEEWVKQQQLLHIVSGLTGGWEKWAQYDFIGYLLHTTPALTIVPEDLPFANLPSGAKNMKKNDFSIHPYGGSPGACVEFKVLLPGSETVAGYFGRLRGDFEKLRDNALETPRLATLNKVVLGLAPTDKLLAHAKALASQDGQNPNLVTLLNFTDKLRAKYPPFFHERATSAGNMDFTLSFFNNFH
ncbi:hypothetical protein OQA88_3195 [Cercophora sp. LCS_1]